MAHGHSRNYTTLTDATGRIAAGIAHELNQPLQVIRLSLQNIERRLRKENFASTIIFDKLGIVSGQIDRAAKIISQVNTFGKPGETAKRAFKINDVIKDTVALLRMQIDDSEATISTHPSDQELWVNVDPLRLEQIIINLVQNARQAIARRKRTSPDAGEITIRSERGQGGVILTVQDNGTGIKHAELELLFEPFFTTKTNEGGTGLGLSVSYGIIQEMGGRIWAENVENGARFSIWLEEGPAL